MSRPQQTQTCRRRSDTVIYSGERIQQYRVIRIEFLFENTYIHVEFDFHRPIH